MKTLYLARHAKSSWKYHELKDIERPLKKRGYENARLISKLLKKGNNIPELILSSPAIRAFETAKIFANEFCIDENAIIKDEKLYMADYDDFMSVIKDLQTGIEKAMLFSHNPGLTYFVCAITGSDIENIPTCGIVRIDFDIDSWNNISSVRGTLVFFEYPKKYESDR